jgi:DNA-binding NarL/FixJ family response regulator
MIAVCIIRRSTRLTKNALLAYLQKAEGIDVVFAGSSLADLPGAIKAAPHVAIMDINLGKDRV